MNWFEILAIVGMPLILFLLGVGALKWTLWDINRRERLHPGE